MTATTTGEDIQEATARDNRVLGVVSLGHFMSHFYYMAPVPLFLDLRDAFHASFTELGALVAVMFIASAIVQVPIGFLVDRIGARAVLVAGLAATAVTTGLIGLAPGYWAAVVLALLSGVANAVFHPTDYAILNSSISARRMGRAFSVHTFAGQLGTASAPVVMIALNAALGWRMALVTSGVLGVGATLLMLSQVGDMRDDLAGRPDASKQTGAVADAAGLRLLLSPAMLMFFLFFAMLSMMQGAMQSFIATALVAQHGTPLAGATTALSAYLFASAAGTLAGGEISDRFSRHDLLAAAAFVLGAAICLLMAWVDLSVGLLIAVMIVMGLSQGVTRPARDMMLRAATPKGATGRVFGFVTSGIALGAAIGPIPFGWLLDIGRPDWVFYLLALFMVASLATVVVPKQPATA